MKGEVLDARVIELEEAVCEFLDAWRVGSRDLGVIDHRILSAVGRLRTIGNEARPSALTLQAPRAPVEQTSSAGDVDAVFNAWRTYQKRPKQCRLNESRTKLIRRALKDHTAAEIRLMLKWAFEADCEECAFLRGESNGGRTYTDLCNLLVIKDGKLSGRVEKAMGWAEEAVQDAVSSHQGSAIDMGPLAGLRGGVHPSPTPTNLPKRARRLGYKGGTTSNPWE